MSKPRPFFGQWKYLCYDEMLMVDRLKEYGREKRRGNESIQHSSNLYLHIAVEKVEVAQNQKNFYIDLQNSSENP